MPDLLHRGIATAVYGGLSLGLRAASNGLDRAAATGAGPRLEADARGRFVSSAVNGLIGDRLVRERPQLAIPMAVRADGRDVPLDGAGLAAAFPDATGRVVVFLHGLCENESYWNRAPRRARHDVRRGAGRPRAGPRCSCAPTPASACVRTASRCRRCMQRLVEGWPADVERIALVGPLDGRADPARRRRRRHADDDEPWTELVSDVVTLGTPHLGAPIARGIGHGSRGMARLPETAAFGRILDWRSVGVHDLVAGLAEDVPPLPHARYRLVAATLTASQRHPVGHVVGDWLVRVPSAYGRDRCGAELFPGADVLHVGRTDHFGLLNHPEVHRALRDWLA